MLISMWIAIRRSHNEIMLTSGAAPSDAFHIREHQA